MYTYNINIVLHAIKFKIYASLSMHNIKIRLIICLVLYLRRSHHRIWSLKDLRVYYHILLNLNWKITDVDAIVIQKGRNFQESYYEIMTSAGEGFFILIEHLGAYLKRKIQKQSSSNHLVDFQPSRVEYLVSYLRVFENELGFEL